MKKTKPPKIEKTPLQRSIESRERAIARAERRKVEIREQADADCAAIDKHLAQSRVLLAAIKRGELKS